MEKIIESINEYLDQITATEDDAFKTVRRILPSWRISKQRGIGLYASNGWRKDYLEIRNGSQIFHIFYWVYNAAWDQLNDACVMYA